MFDTHICLQFFLQYVTIRKNAYTKMGCDYGASIDRKAANDFGLFEN